jgi:hypothetical protein
MSRLAPTFQRVRGTFRWDAQSQRFRLASNGRFVTQAAVKRAVNRVITGAKSEIASLARQVANGSIEIGEFQIRMAAQLKSLHLASVAAARGGFPNLSAADYGRAGQVLRVQYGYLNAFAVDIETGRTSPGRIEQRANLYAAAAGGTYENTRRAAAVDVFTEERRTLHAQESCPDCIAEALKGWAPVGTLREIGDSVCQANCKCEWRFR